MARRLNVAPTKSNHLALTQQLEFAQTGFDLLEQKRQILVYELMGRVGRARDVERRVAQAMAPAFEALREASLAIGSAALESAATAVALRHQVEVDDQHVMGLRLPKVVLTAAPETIQFGLGGTTSQSDVAMRLFTAVLPLLAELAELENSVLRLARELRKTQRRCNALSRIFMPEYEATIDYITASLEEREREMFINLRLIKERLSLEEREAGEMEAVDA